MPKDVFKIEQFHGGLNTSADPRDILDSEVSDITNGMVDQVGVIRSFGSVVDHQAAILNLTGTGMNEVPGAGLFYFAHDRTGAEDSGDSEAESGDSYLALYDDDDAQVWVYSLAGNTFVLLVTTNQNFISTTMIYNSIYQIKTICIITSNNEDEFFGIHRIHRNCFSWKGICCSTNINNV